MTRIRRILDRLIDAHYWISELAADVAPTIAILALVWTPFLILVLADCP